jgi:hypothetical protein
MLGPLLERDSRSRIAAVSAASSSWSVGEIPGEGVFRLPPSDDDSRRMNLPARLFDFLSPPLLLLLPVPLPDLASSPEPLVSVIIVGDKADGVTASLLMDDLRLLMDRRRGNDVFWWTEGGRDDEREGVAGEGPAKLSTDVEVSDLRLSFMKSLTKLRDDRLAFASPSRIPSCDWDRRFSFDILRSWIDALGVSISPSRQLVDTTATAGVAFW